VCVCVCVLVLRCGLAGVVWYLDAGSSVCVCVCVGVTLWFGCGGVVSVCRLKHYWSVHVECGGTIQHME